MSDRETAEFLGTVPLLVGHGEADLVELARCMRRRTVPTGETLWRQGDDPRELVLVVEGTLTASLHVAGGRTVDIATAGPGEIVGDIALLDGGGHTMGVRVSDTATVLTLGRADFAALLARSDPAAFGLRRRLAVLFGSRLRNQLGHLAASLGGEAPAGAAEAADRGFAELEPCGPPDPRYLRRMGTFHGLDALALWGFLTSGRYATCPPGRTLVAEGAPAPACFLTINGAVEQVLVRDDRRVRVGLAGPGRAFGHEGLVDGGPSPTTAVTRERALLLVLPRDPFTRLLQGEDAVSRVVLEVMQRELVAALRHSLRQHVRLAASL